MTLPGEGKKKKKNRLVICSGPSITIFLSKCQFGEPWEMCWLHSNPNVFASFCFLRFSVQSNVGFVRPHLPPLLVSVIGITLVTVLFLISVLSSSYNSLPVFKNVLLHSIWINYICMSKYELHRHMLGAMSLVTFERPGGIDFDIHILAERPLLAGLPFLFLSLLFSFFLI